MATSKFEIQASEDPLRIAKFAWICAMADDNGLQLSAAEISAMFADPAWGSRFPPILDITLAAELARVPIETIRAWRSRGLLRDCSFKVGKRVLFVRNRFAAWLFGTNPTSIPASRASHQSNSQRNNDHVK